MTMPDKIMYQRLGKELRRLREEKEMSLQDVADCVNVAKNTIQRYETGENRISIDMLEKIGECLGTELKDLIEVFYNFKGQAITELVKEVEVLTDEEIRQITRMVRAMKQKD